MDLKNLKNRIQKLDINKIIKNIFDEGYFIDWIIQTNKDQLWEGKTAYGDDITPSYSNDPYFKTREAALRYAAWKQKITPSSKRNKDTPNLYINGAFYGSIDEKVNTTNIETITKTSLGRDIVSKYPTALGITPKSRKELAKSKLLPIFREKFKEALLKK